MSLSSYCSISAISVYYVFVMVERVCAQLLRNIYGCLVVHVNPAHTNRKYSAAEQESKTLFSELLSSMNLLNKSDITFFVQKFFFKYEFLLYAVVPC